MAPKSRDRRNKRLSHKPGGKPGASFPRRDKRHKHGIKIDRAPESFSRSDERPRFEFTDRSGKTHRLQGRRGGEHERGTSAAASAKAKFSREERPSRREAQARGKRPTHGKFRGKLRDERPRGDDIRLKATVDKNRKGFGFLIFEDRAYEDAFLPPSEAERLFHGDRVEVRLSSRGEVTRIKVLEHRFRELVGRFTPHPNGKHRGGWVVYERKRAREEIYCPVIHFTIQPNDWVRALLKFHENGPFAVTGEVLEVYGQNLPPSADVEMVAAEYNLVEEHSRRAEDEAEAMGLEPDAKDFAGREDLRHVPFITIDGETARDFDDAVYVERDRSGYVLWVAIADVSRYVREGTALNREALSRGTSVYFPERAFHMLPRALSENLCSLKPDRPRLAMTARMEFNRLGVRTKCELMESVIYSRRRATYNEIQKEREAHLRDSSWEYAPHFELYELIRKARTERGSIDFDLPEAETIVKPTGEVVSIKVRPRLDAHRLIEEFMIAANEAVTEWMMERGWPFVYRVHEEPAAASLERFQALAATVGIKVALDRKVPPKVLADVVRRVENHPAAALLNTALLRSMKQAVYSSVHDIHYGLASEAYTHFTSPIRRYPDLIVHRLIRRALRVEAGQEPALNPKQRQALEEELTELTEHCSYRERVATDAEREAIKLKQVRLMMEKLGEEFEGRIIGMAESGFFVQLTDPYAEGMVTKESIGDDFYEYNEERMVFAGRRKGRTFKIGDRILVRVVRADIDRRQVDFALVDARASAGAESGNGKEGRRREREWAKRERVT